MCPALQSPPWSGSSCGSEVLLGDPTADDLELLGGERAAQAVVAGPGSRGGRTRGARPHRLAPGGGRAMWSNNGAHGSVLSPRPITAAPPGSTRRLQTHRPEWARRYP